jgi:hypothetical protein
MAPAFAELPRVCEAASLADVLHDQLDYLLASAEHPLANDADRARLARVRLILMSIFDVSIHATFACGENNTLSIARCNPGRKA